MRTQVAGHGKVWAILGILLFVVLMLFRIQVGVDITDEAYYATFIHEWFQQGVGKGDLLPLHQTAALLTYPWAWVFKNIFGESLGLILALRLMYVLVSFLTAAVVFRFVRIQQSAARALAAAIYFFSFIPFALPAPSYNNLGMCCLTAGMLMVGVAITNETSHRDLWAVGAGAVLVVGAFAYPTLTLPVILFVALTWTLRQRRMSQRLTAAVAVSGLLAALILVTVFGTTKLRQMISIQATALGGADSFSKVRDLASQVVNQPTTTLLWLGAFTVGVVLAARRSKASSWELFGYAGAMIVVLIVPITTYSSHYRVVALACFGLAPIAIRPARTIEPERQRFLLIVYWVGLLAGFITAWTSLNGIFNLAIGAMVCSVLALAFALPDTAGAGRRSAIALAIVAIAANTLMSNVQLYRESRAAWFGPRVTDGPFAGLRASPEKLALISQVDSAIDRWCPDDGRILVWTLPAAYLMSGSDVAALSPMMSSANKASQLEYDHLELEANAPDCVVAYDLRPGEGSSVTRWKEIRDDYVLVYESDAPNGHRLQVLRSPDLPSTS